MTNCQHCQKEFTRSKLHPKQKYCSAKCRNTAKSVRNIETGYNRDYYYKHKNKMIPRPLFFGL